MGLLRAYGDETLTRLKENPYLLTDERCGVEFAAADEIALSMGFDGDDPCRTEAAVLYELNHNLSNGHVFLPRLKLIAATMGAAITEGRQGEQLNVSDETAPAEEAPVDTTPRAPRKRASKTAEEIAAQ